MTGIKDKVIAITGASRGIGEATAMMLAGRGAKVVLMALSSEELQAVASRIADAGGAVAHLTGDVRRRDDLMRLVGMARERFARLDVLVSNAGIGPISPLDDLRVDDWEAMVDVNIKGVLHGIAAALPLFRAQGFGHFVNIASMAGYRITRNMAVYAGTKLAVRGISEGLRVEAGDKLRVTVVSPGFVQTTFADAAPNAEVKAQLAASREKFAIPPAAIAAAIAFAIDQPAEVDVNEIVVRPTAQG